MTGNRRQEAGSQGRSMEHGAWSMEHRAWGEHVWLMQQFRAKGKVPGANGESSPIELVDCVKALIGDCKMEIVTSLLSYCVKSQFA